MQVQKALPNSLAMKVAFSESKILQQIVVSACFAVRVGKMTVTLYTTHFRKFGSCLA